MGLAAIERGRMLTTAIALTVLVALLVGAWLHIDAGATATHQTDRADQAKLLSRDALARARGVALGRTDELAPLRKDLNELAVHFDALERGGLWRGRILPAAPEATHDSIRRARSHVDTMTAHVEQLSDPTRSGSALVAFQVASDELIGAISELVEAVAMTADQGHRRLFWFMGAAILSVVGLLGLAFWNVRRDAEARRATTAEHQTLLANAARSEGRFRQLAAQIEEAFWIASEKGLVYTSPAYEQVFGRHRSEPGSGCVHGIDAIHPDDRERVRIAHERASARSYETEFRIIRPDGETRWIRERGFPLETEQGSVYVVAGVASDVTDQKAALEAQTRAQSALDTQTFALSLVEHQLRAVVEHLPDGVCLLGPERNVLRTNELGATYLERLGADLDAITTLGDGDTADVLLAGNGSEHQVVQDPAQATYRISAVPLSEGREGWVLVIRDISTERAHQEQRQQQERLASVGQLAAGIAHDFNNLLTVMIGTAQLLERSRNLDDGELRQLRQIAIQGERATGLVRQILDFSRATAVERKPLDLVPFLREMIRMVRRILPETITIEELIEIESSVVVGNLSQLQQVLTNAATNARDAMPDGGTLRISLENLSVTSAASAPVAGLEPGDYAVWTIADTGRGMDDDVLGRVFEPFFTTKAPGKGTGLGLAQLYGIVMQHEGVVDVSSELGRGSAFTIYLPRTARIEASEPAPPNEMPLGRQETVLLVEDETPVRDAVQAMLEALQYRVLAAADGREALALFGGKRSEINAVVTDVVMPEMGGLELWAALRVRDERVPVIAMSGYPLGTFENDGDGSTLPEEIAGYLHKPVALHQLARALDLALHPNRAAG